MPGTTAATPEAMEAIEATCPACHNLGWVRYDVPPGDPRFGQAIRCACRREADAHARAERARAASDAAPEREGCAFASYVATYNFEALDATRMWANREGPPWLVLYGGMGSGKTHLLGAAFYALLDTGNSPIYAVAPMLLDHIRDGIEEGEYSERLTAVRDCPLLLLDDLGAESRTRWSDEALFKLLDYRYRLRLPLAVASNLSPMDIAADLAESRRTLESRIASRLQDRRLSRLVRMRGPDWRMGVDER